MAEIEIGRLLFPALRWRDGAYRGDGITVEGALEVVGGFMLFGGPRDAAARETERLRGLAGRPLLLGADLERGAGQQFGGCTSLPPAGALGRFADRDTLRLAGEWTAREAGEVGVSWVYAPVADLDIEPENPIVGARSFGAEPFRVAEGVEAWIEGCVAGGGIPCVKHFPGHGRTRSDSHRELPVVDADAAALEEDLVPFEAAVRAGVPSVMTAHVAYPSLDRSGRPATRSPAIVDGLLRRRFGFDGVVVTDALIMASAAGPEGVGAAAVEALAAGVDALLYPDDPAAVRSAVRRALESGVLEVARVREALARLAALVTTDRSSSGAGWGGAAEGRPGFANPGRALRIARECVRWLDGSEPPALGPERPLRLVIVDDDVGGPYPPPSRAPFLDELRRRTASRVTEHPVEAGEGATSDEVSLVALFCDTRGWKGRAGLSGESGRAVRAAAESAGEIVVVLFGHERVAAELPDGLPILCAWGGEAVMQRAAAQVLSGRASKAGPGGPSGGHGR